MIAAPSGRLDDPVGRLRSFCAEEHPYYDAIPSGDPDEIEPVGILVTVAVNSHITNAGQARAIHRVLAEACGPHLRGIPSDTALIESDETGLEAVEGLLRAACSVPRVLVQVVTKVLHRKRRNLIPMLNSVITGFYLEAIGQWHMLRVTQDKCRAASVAVTALRAFRDDLRFVSGDVKAVVGELSADGYEITPVRALEILLWMTVGSRGYYPGQQVDAPRRNASQISD